MNDMYRAVALLLIACMMTGCSGAVEIPRNEIDDPKYREPGNYRIRVKGWEEYLVKRFSVTDSTVVIEELSPGDERFRMGREKLPFVIASDQVVSISKVKINTMGTAMIVLAVGLFAGFIVWLTTTDWDIGE